MLTIKAMNENRATANCLAFRLRVGYTSLKLWNAHSYVRNLIFVHPLQAHHSLAAFWQMTGRINRATTSPLVSLALIFAHFFSMRLCLPFLSRADITIGHPYIKRFKSIYFITSKPLCAFWSRDFAWNSEVIVLELHSTYLLVSRAHLFYATVFAVAIIDVEGDIIQRLFVRKILALTWTSRSNDSTGLSIFFHETYWLLMIVPSSRCLFI